MIRTILSYDFANKTLEKIDKSDILFFLSSVHKGRKIAKATVNRYYSRLSAIFNYAIAGNYIKNSPVKGIKKHVELGI